jgi:hypothetical protein
MRHTSSLLVLALSLVLNPGAPVLAQAPDGLSWRTRATALYLALEPALVLTAEVRAAAQAIPSGTTGEAAVAALIRFAETRVGTGASPALSTPLSELAAGAALNALEAPRLHAALLGVALLRARGEDAVLALANCQDGWSSPDAVTLHDLPAVAWRPRGGMYRLLPGDLRGPLGVPVCPWGRWLPLAPQAGAPGHLPVADEVTTVHRLKPRLAAGSRPTEALAAMRQLLASLLANPGTRYPLHIALRSSWPRNAGSAPLPRRFRSVQAAGFVAATLTIQEGRATLAVDLRVHASPQHAGAERLARLLGPLETALEAIEGRP